MSPMAKENWANICTGYTNTQVCIASDADADADADGMVLESNCIIDGLVG